MKSNNRKITIIGGGNGGQAMAAYCAIKGYSVCLYNRNLEHLKNIVNTQSIRLSGRINATGHIDIITDDIQTATEYSDLIMIVTTANAHKILAELMAPYLSKNKTIILNPGRTGGLWEFDYILKQNNRSCDIVLAEAQTLIYACRIIDNGHVNIIGIKDRVLLSSYNRELTNLIIQQLSDLFTCFIPAKNILQTSFENIGAIFHPCVVLFNAAAIDRGDLFYFYRDMTDNIANFIQKVDKERINIGKKYNVDLISAEKWVSYAYPNIIGENLCEKMKNNPAYYNIISPTSIFSRQLMEDIPTGLVPLVEFGRLANVDVSLMDSMVTICNALLNTDFRESGRNLKSLGLGELSVDEIIDKYDI